MEFEIRDDFFDLFNPSFIERGRGKARVDLEMTGSMIHLHFDLHLDVDLVCDVTLLPYTQPLRTRKKLMVRLGSENRELGDALVEISRDCASINVAHYIYEYACIEVPMKRIHPDRAEQNRPILAYSTK